MSRTLSEIEDLRLDAYTTLVEFLRQAPDLDFVNSWTTRLEPDTEPDEISLSHCPALRLTPYGGPSRYHDSGGASHRAVRESPLLVLVETFTAGPSRYLDSIRFWAALESALYPPKSDLRAAMEAHWRSVGVSRVDVAREAYGPSNPRDATAPILHAAGEISLLLFSGG